MQYNILFQLRMKKMLPLTCKVLQQLTLFFRLDHSLYKAHRYNIRHSPRRSISGGPTEWEVILTEMKAQLYMYCGLILIWLAKEVSYIAATAFSGLKGLCFHIWAHCKMLKDVMKSVKT